MKVRVSAPVWVVAASLLAWSSLGAAGFASTDAVASGGEAGLLAQGGGAETDAEAGGTEGSTAEKGDAAESDGARTDAAGRGARGFEAGQQQQPQEQVSGYNLMVAAYIAIWLILAGYLFALWRRQKGVGDELGDLRSSLEKLEDVIESGPKEDRLPQEPLVEDAEG